MNIPYDFAIRTKQWLRDEYDLLEHALQDESPVSIRVNPSKKAISVTGLEKVGWCDTGYYLPERPSFTFDPLFHAGCYYVQEASSMFLEQAVKQCIYGDAMNHHPVVCLDLCAAPGGKSTHLQSLLPAKSLLVSNEVINNRASVLKENLTKWGSPYTIVTQNDPKEIGKLTYLFDVIVADLPCSGEGMFRKVPDSRNEWSVDNVKLCAARQRRIIHDVWESLKPGGFLIYSTCTFNREENEENIRYIIEHLGAEALPVSVETGWNISGSVDESFPAYRFYPHHVKGEGFFLALLRKSETVIKTSPCPLRRGISAFCPPSEGKSAFCPPLEGVGGGQTCVCHFKEWLSDPDDFYFDIKQNRIRAIPVLYQDTFRLLSNYLRILSAGVLMGEIKGKDFVPLPALALNTFFRDDAFPSVELTWEESIRYLQKETLVLPSTIPNGYVVVKYRNTPLGFVKNIGSRANNLFPGEWRIRKTVKS